MCNWVAFFWIGARAKQRKWILFGCMYLVLCFVLPLVGVTDGVKDTVLEDTFIYIYMAAWVASVVHAFLSRKEYLIRREAIVANQEAVNYAYRQRIQQQHGYPQQFAQNPVSQQPKPAVPPQPIYPTQNYEPQPATQVPPIQQVDPPPLQKIDLNTATEQELSKLPGVSVALAKKAVEMRVQTGGFASMQDFNQRLGLMPHFATQIESIAFVTPIIPKTPPEENKGRVIDI